MTARTILPLFAFVVVCGCNNSVSTCEQLVKLDCERAFRCCEDNEVHRFGAFAYVSSAGDCQDAYGDVCKAIAGADESVANGRATFDEEQANICIEQATKNRDNCTLDVANGCDTLIFIDGTVKAGDTCADAAECQDGGACEVALDATGLPKDVDVDTGTVVGACVGVPGEGEQCQGTCQSGLSCDFIDGTCKRLRNDGDDCVVDRDCLSNFCDSAVATCAAPPSEDNFCDGRK